MKAAPKASFHKIDLHIHTPASKCYRGRKENEEYVRILEKAKKSNISIIAITDHNSIEGYSKIMDLRNQFEKELAEDSSQADRHSTKFRKKSKILRLFSEITILPGVEIEVRDGVHFLVIFSQQTPLENIIKLLSDCGYKKDAYGFPDPPILPNWDVLTFYEEVKKYNCLVIDAHTDSTKGIYNTISNGKYRSLCFKSEFLNGICYKSEEQKDKLRSILLTSLDYKRTEPVAFLKFSDSHSCEEVGSEYTWFKVDDLSFESVRKAMSNPDENISVEMPEVARILDNLINKNNTVGIRDLSESSMEELKKAVCALNNSDGGHCLIGLTPQKNKVGVDFINEDSVNAIKQQLSAQLSELDSRIRPNLSVYRLRKNKIIISVYVRQSDVLVSLKREGAFYILSNNVIERLTGPQVTNLVQSRQVNSTETSIRPRLEEISKQIKLIDSYFQAIPILKRFESNSIELTRITTDFKAFEQHKATVDLRQKLYNVHREEPNGKSKGNVLYVSNFESPRLPYACLRFSLPLFYLREIPQDTVKYGETIYIIPGGATYYSSKKVPFVTELPIRVLTFGAKKTTSYSNKYLVAFLKSSFMLWYALSKFNSHNLYEPSIFYGLKINNLNTKDKVQTTLVQRIESTVDEVLKLEKAFLVGMASGNKPNEFIEQHNLKTDQSAYVIDECIYDLINLTSAEREIIRGFLSTNMIHVPQAVKS
jgi:hypothetical protein